MKTLHISEDILTFDQLSVDALHRVNRSGRPMVITESGKPIAVLLSPQAFDTLVEEQQFIRAVREGLADADAGRLIDDDRLDRELDTVFGPLDEV